MQRKNNSLGITLFLFSIILTGILFSAAGQDMQSKDDPIIGIWEGKKVDGRFNTTEPWGPFEIKRNSDGSLSATYLGSRLGERDLPMYDVSLNNGKFHLKMNRWGGAILEAKFSPEKGIAGTLRHHGMVEDLSLQRIPNRTNQDILALLESGKIAKAPPYQSEFMSVLIKEGAAVATKIYESVIKEKPGYQIWGPGAVNSWGYKLLNQNKTREAVEVFKLNVMAYPEDPNSFDSLGEGYMRNGDRKLAIKALKKSLSMNPPRNVRENSIKLLKELGVDYEGGDS